jgi:phosphoribosylaminoimidazolecarboxamide formyltransferase/IMP cyclohydrolase
MEKCALVSIFAKEGVENLVRTIEKAGYRILSTGGTLEYLRNLNVQADNVEELTRFPEAPGGRVKTLHPAIFAGILARRDNEEDLRYLEQNRIPLIDFVIVNLYPFSDKRDLDLDSLLEFIDIGGISLIRAAAKNFKWVTLVCDPSDYNFVAEAISIGTLSEEVRLGLALKGFEKVVEYDSIIHEELSRRYSREAEFRAFIFRKSQELRYGENPHQKGSVYLNALGKHSFLRNIEILNGIELSYNNILDAYSSWNVVSEFSEDACAIIKHNIPCGVGIAENLGEAYEKALKGDEVSAYGGIVALNGIVEDRLAELLNEFFFEVVIARDFTDKALEVLRRKKKRRILRVRKDLRNELEYRFIDEDLLIQQKDIKPLTPEALNVVSGTLEFKRVSDIIFGDKVIKHVKSNAIVVVKDGMTVGIGGGQTSRVDAVKIALEKAGERAKDAVLVSDGFFPFTDSIDLAYQHGVKIVVEPGGSVRDQDVIDRAKELGITLVFTGLRRFRH